MSDKLLTADAAITGASLRARAGVAAFVLASALSAALLFAVEPMFTRMVLPLYGGSASVWSVAIAFFQTALLAGYAYAHLLIRYAPPRLAPFAHIGVLALGALFLPLEPASGWSPGPEQDESLSLLLLFALSIGLPFAALSASAPLLQAWFARSELPGAHNPYPLYAASNAGSLGALLAYPFVIEPVATLGGQAKAWAWGYGALALLIACAGVMTAAWRGGALARRPPARPLSRRRIAVCVYLAAIPSAALVAVTAHISTDIAAAPFLWVIPLALYLTTFIIAFGARGSGWMKPVEAATPFLMVGVGVLLAFGIKLGPALDGGIHLAVFFFLALFCHGRLAELRPDASRLTDFYLAISFGGVVGGALAALVAPRVFNFVAEYPAVLLLCALALRKHAIATVGALIAVPLLALAMPSDVRFRETSRSFFGVHTIEVSKDGQFRTLRHGAEVHGAQRIADEAGRPVAGKPAPLAYYHNDSPISEAIDAARARAGGGAMRVGVVGLGAGGIACLAERTDSVDFYEIDPEVIRIARESGNFTFLSQCAPAASIIRGDARLTLAASKARYRVLILDAFSSDAIPTHLLTRQAMRLYMERLEPGGMLVMHISNNHLRLNEVVASTARSLGLHVLINDENEPDDAPPMTLQANVAAIADDPAHFGDLRRNDDWQAARPEGLPRPWTDDYSNLLGALIAKLRER